ncbi:MAG: T9SS type A sorting domain-containing protein, partial [Bacteroidia bacterium]|nr:T9SS type A sorting domain-containing protein [Bacteroidia bacterium]
YDQSVVGISNKMAESFDGKIWPNPANDFFTLQLNNDNLLNAKIDIVNALGKTVSTVEINENTKSIVIDTKQLNSGIYHILIQTENKKYATKFLKK